MLVRRCCGEQCMNVQCKIQWMLWVLWEEFDRYFVSRIDVHITVKYTQMCQDQSVQLEIKQKSENKKGGDNQKSLFQITKKEFMYNSQQYKSKYIQVPISTSVSMFNISKIANKTNKNANINLAMLSVNDITLILSYLSLDDLKALVQSIQVNKCSPEWVRFKNMCELRLVFMMFWNKADRGYYFSIYELNYYKMLEDNRISYISNTDANAIFCDFPTKFNKMVQQCSQYVNLELREKFTDQLQEFFVDPFLPMPKLSRQTTVNMTTTALQSHILSIADPSFYLSHDSILFSPFYQLHEHQLQQEQLTFKSAIKNVQKLAELINSGQSITENNYTIKHIEGNSIHNMLVNILAITDLHLENIHNYLMFITDPFQLLLELTCRYTRFVNTVIAVEENLGFMFKSYRDIYEEIYERSASSFSFWKLALKKWTQKMHKYHEITTKAYTQLLFSRISIQSFATSAEIPSILSSKLLIAQRMFLSSLDQYHEGSVVYELLSKDDNQIRILLKMYEGYLVDCSIQEDEVFYCMHSDKKFGGVYAQFQENVVSEQRAFVQILKQIRYSDEQSGKIKQYIQCRINELQEMTTPSTLKMIIRFYLDEQVPVKSEKTEVIDSEIQRYVKFMQNSNKRELKLYGLNEKMQKEVEDSMTDSTGSFNGSKGSYIQDYTSQDEMDMEDIEEAMEIQNY